MQYRPLDPSKREIRLVKLYPRAVNTTTQEEHAPRCDLIHVSLDDKPDYAALSYTWGDPRDTEMITVGQSSVPVTRQLHSALAHLRYDKTIRVIWIDALCINQVDNEEKSWHIQLMREIYQRATFVTIWLGLADETSDEVMDFLLRFGTRAMSFGFDRGSDLAQKVIAQWESLASHPPSFRDRSRQQVIIKSGYSSVADRHFVLGDLNELYYSISGFHEQDFLLPVEGIANFFKRPWWGRIWVLQEISLALKAGFVCGTKRLSRRCCTAALNAFRALASVFQGMQISKQVTLTAYQKSIATADFYWRPTIQLGMWDPERCSSYLLVGLLRATRFAEIRPPVRNLLSLEATNPRDKIYGLLGLAADKDELMEFGVQVDYSKSCQDVYISVTAAMLRQGHLPILSLNYFPKAQMGLPSWVPDWSQPLGSPLYHTGANDRALESGYKASGSLPPTLPILSGIGATMSVSVAGFVCDELHDIGVGLVEFHSLEETKDLRFLPAKRLLEELVRLSFLQGKLYKDLKERICGAARTVTAELGYQEKVGLARIGNGHYEIAAYLLSISGNGPGATSILDSELIQLIKSDGIQTAKSLPGTLRFRDEIEVIAHGRKPFVTKKGHLGLGPDHAEPGDAIALLIGCQVPFVLRKSMDGRYEIVGEAYVDGIMDGEAVVGRENVGTLEMI